MRIAVWPLALGWFALFRIAQNSARHDPAGEQDWMRVPGSIRIIMRRSKVLLFILFYVAVALKVWSLKSQEHASVYRFVAWVLVGSDIAFMFALEALFFRYGELRRVTDARQNFD